MKTITRLFLPFRRQSIRTQIVLRSCASFLIALFITFVCALPLVYLVNPYHIHFYIVFLTAVFTILLIISLAALIRPWSGGFTYIEMAIRQEINEPLEDVVRKIELIRSSSNPNQEEQLRMIQDTCTEIIQIQDRLKEYIR